MTWAADKPQIVPHRAVYDMTLASVKNGSSVAGVSGQMTFEWADACEGWAVQQHMNLHFSYAEGDETNIKSAVVTWESKDGKRFTFNVRRTADGKETDNFRGRATIADPSGSAHYTTPKAKTVTLPPGTLFPSAHTSMILQKAALGEKLFTKPVFDGSDEDGLADISAFIGLPIAPASMPEMSPALKGNPLLAASAWPVRMAFFKPNTETGEPDYEMNLTLLSNGVTKFMRIDYGDFSVNGTLSHLESLPASGC